MKIIGPSLFVGVYGSMVFHPWIEADTRGEDAYSLFVSRSTSMRWSSTSSHDPSVDLWGMNDAGLEWSRKKSPYRVSWYQVTVVAEDQKLVALPIQPVLACIEYSLHRLGQLHLTSLQLLLPVHLSDAAHSRIVSSIAWFDLSEPDEPASVRITLDAGEDGDLFRDPARILTHLSDRSFGKFKIDSHSFDADLTVSPTPPVVGDLWMGAARNRISLQGTIPEWSFDSLACLSMIIVEVCRRCDARTTVLMSVDKA